MIARRSLVIALFLLFAGSGIVLATWYDDYEAGVKAVRAGQWSLVIQKMTSAINQKGKENSKERAYGTLFENYHPYYYRGAAYLNTGQYEKAIADLDQAIGPGEEDLGSIENLHQRAQLKLDQRAQSEPAPAQPAPVQTRPAPVPPPVPTQTASAPSVPALDPAARQRADAALSKANQRILAAQARRATESPSYRQAAQSLADANLRRATAKTTDEFNQIAALAENAAVFADSAQVQAAGTPAPPPRATAPKPAAATEAVLGDAKKRVRHALEQYFNGDFDTAATELDKLAHGDMKTNGMVWAFLGASQYSIYAFEADPQYREAAIQSFARARKLRPSLGRTGLPDRYFSKRIRNFFRTLG